MLRSLILFTLAFSEQLCTSVNSLREFYGISPQLRHSSALQELSEMHLKNLIDNDYDPLNDMECDPHRWFEDPEKNINECCVGCMQHKGTLVNYNGVVNENFYGTRKFGWAFVQVTSSGININSVIDMWSSSPGHNRTMMGDFTDCGAAMVDIRTNISVNAYHYTGLAALWVGKESTLSPLPPSWQPPIRPPTISPNHQPPIRPPTYQPTYNSITHQPTTTPTYISITYQPTTTPTYNSITHQPTTTPTLRLPTNTPITTTFREYSGGPLTSRWDTTTNIPTTTVFEQSIIISVVWIILVFSCILQIFLWVGIYIMSIKPTTIDRAAIAPYSSEDGSEDEFVQRIKDMAGGDLKIQNASSVIEMRQILKI